MSDYTEQSQEQKIKEWDELFEALMLGVIFGEIETKQVKIAANSIQLDFSGKSLGALPHAKSLLALPTIPPSSFKRVYKNPIIADYVTNQLPEIDINFEQVVTHIGHEIIIDQSNLDYHPWLNAMASGINKMALTHVHIRVFIIVN